MCVNAINGTSFKKKKKLNCLQIIVIVWIPLKVFVIKNRLMRRAFPSCCGTINHLPSRVNRVISKTQSKWFSQGILLDLIMYHPLSNPQNLIKHIPNQLHIHPWTHEQGNWTQKHKFESGVGKEIWKDIWCSLNNGGKAFWIACLITLACS